MSKKIKGLTSEEVKLLKIKYGDNTIITEKKESKFIKVLKVLTEPMFLLLIIAASIYFILGEPTDGIIMLIFVLGIITIETIQEYKTDKTIAALKKLSSPTIEVLRDEQKIRINTIDLLPGDIMYIHEGVKIPADGYIVKCSGLKVDESLLTGESLPVLKSANEKTDDYWKLDYCYQGTLVTNGNAIIKVDKIGNDTEYGKIGYNLSKIKDKKTPLQNQISNLVKICAILAAILFVTVTFFTFLTLNDYSLKERVISSILSGITIAMALIPEEFPVVLTVFMSMGAWRLAKKKSLIKKLPSVETLGAVSTLCVDKTGTITQNKMKIENINTNLSQEEFLEYALLSSMEEAFDPMEKAIYKKAKDIDIKKYNKIKEYPLNNESKMMANVWMNKNKIIISAKGSPENILKQCNITQDEYQNIKNSLEKEQEKGYRVIAVAFSKETKDYIFPESITDLSLEYAGFISFIDPPKNNIEKDIALCKKAGINVIMITGDNGITASNIASQVGINNKNIITGDMLEEMTEKELLQAIKNCNIFSRVLPKHKKRIVEALQKNGEIVAMTGDGVNDAEALKQADIGIAMGDKGSEVCAEAADLILLDDNFKTIIDTIKDGRRIYENIKKSVGYIISIHIPIALSSLLCSILGINPSDYMLLPLHVVLLELIIDPTCSIVLERQMAEPNIMNKPPRNVKKSIIDKSIILKSVIQGLVIFIFSFIPYYMYLSKDIQLARTIGFIILILSNIFLVQVNFSSELTYKNIPNIIKDKLIIIINFIIIILILVITYTNINHILKLTPLPLEYLLITVIISIISVYWYDIIKLIKKQV